MPAVDPAVEAAAWGLLARVGQTFSASSAAACTTRVDITAAGRADDLTVRSTFGPNATMRVESLGSSLVVADGYLNIVDQRIHDRYIRVPVGARVADAVEGVFNDLSLAGFEVLMRDGFPPQAWLDPLLMRAVGGPRPIDMTTLETADGRKITRIAVAGYMGRGVVDIDPDRFVLLGAAARMSVVPEQGAEPIHWEMQLRSEVALLEALEAPITFDPGVRQPVTTRRELDPVARNRVEVGQEAPALKAKDLSGNEVDLTSFRGRPVVLDFWTSWGEACASSLDQLQTLADSAGSAGDDGVVVLPVNVMERMHGEEDRFTQARAYWKQGGWTMPTLVAPAEAIQTAWGVTSVPLQILIDPQGRVSRVWNGLRPDWPKEIRAALRSIGGSRR